MIEFFNHLFGSEFMPHGHCYLWRPELLWLHAISDCIITLSYYFIPLALIYNAFLGRFIAGFTGGAFR